MKQTDRPTNQQTNQSTDEHKGSLENWTSTKKKYQTTRKVKITDANTYVNCAIVLKRRAYEDTTDWQIMAC